MFFYPMITGIRAADFFGMVLTLLLDKTNIIVLVNGVNS